MKRREFIKLVGVTAMLCSPAWCTAWAADTRSIGILMPGKEDDQNRKIRLEAFRQTLAKLGWTEANNLRIDVRWGGADPALFDDCAAELVKLKPDVLFSDGTPALEALLRQTRTIPIVFVAVADPVAQGLVAGLPRPGGNITGFATTIDPAMAGKWLEMLAQIVPPIASVGILYNPATMPNQAEPMIRAVEDAARPRAITVRATPINNAADIGRTMAELAGQPHGGIVVLPSSFTVSNRAEIIELAARFQLPAVYSFPYFATDGGLMSYGVNVTDLHIRSAGYVDRILKGERPGDLPIQMPVKFDLVINLRAAKAQNISIGPSLIVAADEIIE